ncbi:MAG: ATP-dependent helicase [Candidatus Omnitrophota bacterium]|nr:ATP-dependent helicase [Candidatus Omnitrophota bacterium]
MDEDILTISPARYEHPEITRDVQEKINRLRMITSSIERNLIQSPGKGARIENLKIDYEKSLNDTQYIAATTIDGPFLVIAGAGSGKTRVIVYRTAFLLENKVLPQEILLLTFTRKAANEMLLRVGVLLADSRHEKVMGGTFHSVANYLLRRYSKTLNISPNFTIIDTVDSEDIIGLLTAKMHFQKRDRAFPRKGQVQEIISKARNCNIQIKAVIDREFDGLTEFISNIELIGKAYSEHKKASNLFDYDDLMEFFRDSLRDNLQFRESIHENFRYIMVDEFQDTNTIQKEIVDLIAQRHRNIMVVGDDSQSIYSFRGANFENILRFPETYPDCRFVKIEENYRSSQDILDFTNSVIENAKLGYKKKLFSTKACFGRPIVKKFDSLEQEAEYIVSKILKIKEEGVSLNQIAVLYRASFHSNFIQAELLKRDIPYVVFGGIRFIERRHVKDIIAYLRVIFNPKDSVSWMRILKLIPGIGDITAGKILDCIQSLDNRIILGDSLKHKCLQEVKKLEDILNHLSKTEIAIFDKIGILKKYYSPILKRMESDYETRLKDIDTLCRFADRYDNLEKFLSDFTLDPPSTKYQNQTNPFIDEIKSKPLVLSTIHSAKGLEWDSVFIPHLLDGLFPSVKTIEDIEEIEEERRLFYVACTRAKQRLYLTMPSYIASWNDFFSLPSRFLAEVRKEKYTD